MPRCATPAGLAPDPAGGRRRHHPQQLPQLRRGRDLRPETRLDGHPGVLQLRRLRLGSQALQSARAQIMAGLCDVALVIGADTTPKGFLRAGRRERPQRPGLAAVPPDRGHQHRLLRAAGPPPDGPLRRHRRGLRRSEGEELPARPRQPRMPGTARRPRSRTCWPAGGLRSAAAARHLRDLRRCRSGDRRVEGVHRETPRQHRGRAVGAGHLHGHAELPAASARIAGHRNRFHRRCTGTGAGLRDHILDAAYAEAGIGPEDLSVAEVYDLSTALELDWYEHLGLCPRGEAEQLLRSGATAIGGRIPVNPSGGLASFGEAIPAQRSRRSANSPGNSRGPGHRPPGRGRHCGHHRQPGPVRSRLLGDRRPLSPRRTSNRCRGDRWKTATTRLSSRCWPSR